MLRFMRLIAMLCLFALLMIVSLISIPPDSLCQRAIALETYERQSFISDFDSGIHLKVDSVDEQITLDGQYRYSVLFPETGGSEVYLAPAATRNYHLFYRTSNMVKVYLSADSQSIFIAEGEPSGQVFLHTERLFRMDIISGNVLQEYGSMEFKPLASPDNRFLYIIDTRHEHINSINTNTGELIEFARDVPVDLQTWSSDMQWIALQGHEQTVILNAETGEAHPAIQGAMLGIVAGWTNQSLWLRTGSTQNGFSVRQVNLSNGEVRTVYDSALHFRVSSNDRWHMTWHQNGDDYREVISRLHDSEAGINYPDSNFYRVDFSEDERCMLAIPFDDKQDEFTLTVYLLEPVTIVSSQTIHLRDFEGYGDIDIQTLRWYEED